MLGQKNIVNVNRKVTVDSISVYSKTKYNYLDAIITTPKFLDNKIVLVFFVFAD